MNKIIQIKFILLYIAGLVGPISSPGQQVDTSIWIDPLSITASHPNLTGVDSVDHNAHPLSYSLADILRASNNIYFKDYGPGSSATVSMNGGKANEVSLIWDGITVSNPMLGLNDFSLISAGEEYKVRVADMTASSVLGAGSIAGAVLLDPQMPEKPVSLAVDLGASSLHQFTGKANFSGGNHSYRHQTVMEGQHAKNDFKYMQLDGNTTKMVHAQTRHFDGRHHSRFLLNKKTTLSAALWARKHFREIPPTLTEAESRASQEDEFIRSVLTLHHIDASHAFVVKTYYGFQNQLYQDPGINLHARHRFHNAQIKMDNQWSMLPALSVKYGIHENYFVSISENYNQPQTQNRLSAYTQVLWDINQSPVKMTALIRPEWVSDQAMQWTGNIQWHFDGFSSGRWTLHGSRNIAWPTLNDLYWVPGGNSNLQPEENWWAGLSHSRYWNGGIRTKVKGFHRRSKNWIQWLPTKQGIWRPENHRSARIYGVNLEVDKHFSSTLFTTIKYQYVRVFLPEYSEQNLQAIYTPVHMGTAIVGYTFHPRLTFDMSLEYTSTRYVLQDHTDRLDPYFLINPALRYRHRNDGWSMAISLKNALNAQYEGIKNRPMPGRVIEINTQYKF